MGPRLGPMASTSEINALKTPLEWALGRNIAAKLKTKVNARFCVDMKKCYLVSTDHLEEGLWFRDEDDFITGMNYVAIQAYLSKVTVLAFILMSNHLHFVVFGRWEDVLSFINGIKARYSRYIMNKYGIKEFLRRNKVDIQEVEDVPDAIRRVIAYVQMNSVAANICAFANQYQWGTGDVFFNPATLAGKRVADCSKRELRRLLRSKEVELPGDWIIGKDGYILPSCYVSIKYVEELYGNPSRMNYFLNSSSKARKTLERTEQMLPSFKDQVIVAAMPDLYRSLFGKKTFGDLNSEEKSECLRQVRYRFSADVKQLARVTGISYSEAADLLDKA